MWVEILRWVSIGLSWFSIGLNIWLLVRNLRLADRYRDLYLKLLFKYCESDLNNDNK